MVLDFAQALFCAVNQPEDPSPAFEKLFSCVDRFLAETGYEPFIWGCGDIEDIQHNVDLEGILGSSDSFTLSGGKYAQIQADAIERADPARLKVLKELSRVLTKEEYTRQSRRGIFGAFCREHRRLRSDS